MSELRDLVAAYRHLADALGPDGVALLKSNNRAQVDAVAARINALSAARLAVSRTPIMDNTAIAERFMLEGAKLEGFATFFTGVTADEWRSYADEWERLALIRS